MLSQVNPEKAWRPECRNRKNGLSLNVVIVAGASYRVYSAISKGGSQHDMSILEGSNLFTLLNVDGWRPFPGSVLLGDKAFTVCIIKL